MIIAALLSSLSDFAAYIDVTISQNISPGKKSVYMCFMGNISTVQHVISQLNSTSCRLWRKALVNTKSSIA